MKTKICTDIEQSKKLLELGLSPESADMWRLEREGFDNRILVEAGDYWNVTLNDTRTIPSWSLSALFELMPDELEDNHFLTIDKVVNEYCCSYEDINGNSFHHFLSDNPIDAAFKMVCYLKENNKI